MPPVADGFDAWIEVDGKRLEEFKVKESVDEDGIPDVECWVPSVAGKAFRIGCSLPATELKRDNLAIDACIDGWEVVLPDCFIPKSRSVSGPTVVYFEGDLLDGDSAVQSFQFDTLEVADDESCPENEDEELGLIHLHIYSYIRTVAVPVRPAYIQEERRTDYRIHERAKKRVPHCVKFGEVKPNTNSKFVKATGTAELCHFYIHYRDIGTLVADRIAPPGELAAGVPLHPHSHSPPASAIAKDGHRAVTNRTVATADGSGHVNSSPGVVAISDDEDEGPNPRDVDPEADDDAEMEALAERIAHWEKLFNIEKRISELQAKNPKSPADDPELDTLKAHAPYLRELVEALDRVDKLKTKRWGTGCSGSEAEGIEAEVGRLEARAKDLKTLVENQARIRELAAKKRARSVFTSDGHAKRPKRVKTEPREA